MVTWNSWTASSAQRIRQTGAPALLSEERLRVVAAVHRVVVQQSRDPPEADEPEIAVWRRPRRHQRERRPAPRVRREVRDRRLIDVGGEIGLLGD